MADSFVSGVNKSYADVYDASSSALSNKIGNTDFSQATDDELMSVCKDFESYFLEQVLKSMEKMAKVDSDDEDSNLFSSMVGITDEASDSTLSTMTSYFGDEMTKKYASLITESNHGEGLGIAQKLYDQMKRNYSSSSIKSVDADNTEV